MGIRIGIGSLKIGQGSTGVDWSSYWTKLKNLVTSKVTPKLTGNNSTFDGAGDWVTGLGSLTPDVTTVPGNMLLDFTSGSNQAVKIVDKVETGAGHGYLIKIRCKIQSGAGTTLQLGSFAGTVNADYGVNIIPTTTMRWYYAYLHSFVTTTFYIGVVAANNNGTDFLIDEIHIDEVALADLYDLDLTGQTKYNVDGLWSGLSKSAQTFLQIGIAGDSLMANNLGAIPAGNDEGDTMRPIRLDTNTIPRKLYDLIKYNPAIYRDLSHADWTKSVGATFTETRHFGSAAGESHYTTIVANAYCEITVPDGYENFVMFFLTDYQYGGVAYDDAIAATINGGDISAYGSATINTYNVYKEAANYQNQLTIVKYEGLPAGDNVIRFTKSNNTKPFTVWGGCYWSGNTLNISNYGYGGESVEWRSLRLKIRINDFNIHNWIIEESGFIDNGSGFKTSVITYLKQLLSIIDISEFDFNNTLFLSMHPFGTDPTDSDPNYYTTYNDPVTLKQRMTLNTAIYVYTGVYFVDLFRYIEEDIATRGGTLAGGEAGSYYTSDGMHEDDDGAAILAGFLFPRLPAISD